MPTVTNFLHPAPLSFEIAQRLNQLVSIAEHREKTAPSFENKAIVVLSKTAAAIGGALDVVVIAIEALASGILGATTAGLHIATRAKSPALQDFSLKCISYAVSSLFSGLILYDIWKEQENTGLRLALEMYGVHTMSACFADAFVGSHFDKVAGKASHTIKEEKVQAFRQWLSELKEFAKKQTNPNNWREIVAQTLFEIRFNQYFADHPLEMNPAIAQEVITLYQEVLDLTQSHRISLHLLKDLPDFKSRLAQIDPSDPEISVDSILDEIQGARGLFANRSDEEESEDFADIAGAASLATA